MMGRERDQADERLAAFRVDRAALPYLYRQVAGHIAGRIAAGQLAQPEVLPSELSLAREYGVALGTARRAIELLRHEGLLITIRSKGTFVVAQATEHDARRIAGMDEIKPDSERCT